MDLLDTRLMILALMAAMGYGLATIGMKLASGHWTMLAGGLILLGFFAAMQSEIILMRGVELGVLYLVIIAAETLIVLGYAFAIGEGLSLRESFGALLIFAGIAVVME
ncbi:5-aminolevulinate synthase [Roseovarius sp. 2305UL8-3]|uniref:5-aminolevulinate synthase n=1 Tax=Roseovarius conchicola TaxID=3121636 RepID=UPI003529AA67